MRIAYGARRYLLKGVCFVVAVHPEAYRKMTTRLAFAQVRHRSLDLGTLMSSNLLPLAPEMRSPWP